MQYEDFLARKQFVDVAAGFQVETSDLVMDGAQYQLKPFQSALVRWALARGRAALFEDTGLGKTAQQCVWAHMVARHTDAPVIIFAPLAVAKQTVEEAAKFGVNVEYVRDGSQVEQSAKVYVTNYEMQQHFDAGDFSGVVLDESSILKSQDGRTRTEMIERWGVVPYRLSCTATPSPNDFMELGNQAQFLGIMSMAEMLAMFFTHDGGETQSWVLKGHGKRKFWEWLSTWAAFVRLPSDIGFDDEGYILPHLNIIEHEVQIAKPQEAQLFAMQAQTLQERRQAKRDSLEDRCKLAAELVNASDEEWIVWCHLNDEQDALERLITREGKTSVRGADSMDDKESRMMGFTHGDYTIMISKPSICGFGMNWQHSHNMVFVGLDDSFEKFYQAVRRQYRFGQAKQVNVHIISSDGEGSIKANIERKQKQHEEMAIEMVSHMRDLMKKRIIGASMDKKEYNPQIDMEIPEWLK